ncbi:MAG: glycosyltransferase family 2 protein [bacterium]|jgi:N-acetylglucosaminyl-diphospho-decaprenol L-rhamnosyltransferase|nr:glycosyltransferase family 2 protein [Phycisphaerales bacterium]MCE2653077.1 glycosyltransferase family 2 protein [Planctomycetaceae bacterium]
MTPPAHTSAAAPAARAAGAGPSAVAWPPPPATGRPRADLVVLIVNFRTPELTIDALQTLAAEASSLALHAVVLDNASGDDSVDRLQAAIHQHGWSPWVTLARSATNRGFAGGNNAALEAAPDADFVLMLNSDTLVRPGTPAAWTNFMRANPAVGAFAGRLSHRDGSFQVAGRRFPTPLRVLCGSLGLPWRFPRLFAFANTEYQGWDMTATGGEVDWLGGAAVIVRREAVQQVGLLDTDFFFYGEDVEFSWRLLKAGWRVRYEPIGEIIHFGGASSDPAKLPASSRSIHSWRGRYLVQRKCFGRPAEWLARILDLGFTAARLALRSLTGRGRTPEADALRGTLATLRRPLWSAGQ